MILLCNIGTNEDCNVKNKKNKMFSRIIMGNGFKTTLKHFFYKCQSFQIKNNKDRWEC